MNALLEFENNDYMYIVGCNINITILLRNNFGCVASLTFLNIHFNIFDRLSSGQGNIYTIVHG